MKRIVVVVVGGLGYMKKKSVGGFDRLTACWTVSDAFDVEIDESDAFGECDGKKDACVALGVVGEVEGRVGFVVVDDADDDGDDVGAD